MDIADVFLTDLIELQYVSILIKQEIIQYQELENILTRSEAIPYPNYKKKQKNARFKHLFLKEYKSYYCL